MTDHVNSIANRLSLRPPQRASLEILARVCDLLPLEKGGDPAVALAKIRTEFESVTDFERDFPSLCFALATGVGKTRLMGAFIAHLFKSEQIRHFFVLAPNLTIYQKLIADFTPNTPKYVFQGISEFTVEPPEIITGDNYESGRGVRGGRLFDSAVHINIFNISKINTEVRGDQSPRIKRLSEYIGESYFEYLSKLDDLVLLMDESHRYRASAGIRAINELKPILGLELTATPQVERRGDSERFKNVIYAYPLSDAMRDGFVKEPAVATRENFNASSFLPEELEKLKLEDGIHLHEETKVKLQVYAQENGKPIVKPFMLVVAKDTDHADQLVKRMEDPSFFSGRYKGKVITVHSNLRGEEADETVAQLMSVERSDNQTEIVVHVNMLKEGWDVTNLYTIVPLRPANSKTLVEQSIGRGLRLPYGKRTGVPEVDRLTIVAHDKFQEIIDYANSPESVIHGGLKVVHITDRGSKPVEAVPIIEKQLAEPSQGSPQPLFDTPGERQAARITLEILKDYDHLPRSADLEKPEVRREIVKRVEDIIAPPQGTLTGFEARVDVSRVVEKTIRARHELSIDIPKISVQPKGDVKRGYRAFTLACKGVNLQPVAHDVLIHVLQTREQYRLADGRGVEPEARLEDYLVRGLINMDDVSYDDHSDLLYGLSGQMVKHLQGYLKDEDEVRNVLQYHQQALVDLIHAQMQEHYEERATEYEPHVNKGWTTLRHEFYSVPETESVRDFRAPVENRLEIRRMYFSGFKRCLRDMAKFDSDPERRFAVVLEKEADREILKWFRPGRGDLHIYYRGDDVYEADFVVETKTGKYICEVKASGEMNDPVVQDKARAAVLWCAYATDHARTYGGKPWSYLLIPDNVIAENMTLAGLAAAHTVK